MKKTDIIIKTGLTVFLAIAVYIFWAVPYRSALSYQEQFQLFQLDSEYLAEHLSWPGGMATYISEFFVQFFNNYWIGALLVAIAMVATQWLTYKISVKTGAPVNMLTYVASFLTPVVLWIYMGDINHMPAFSVSILGALLAAYGFTCIKNKKARLGCAVIGLPIAYWLIGASIYLLVALMCVCIAFSTCKKPQKIAACVALCIYCAVLVTASAFITPYPLKQLLMGINFYRLQVTIPVMQYAVWIVTVLAVIAAALLAKTKEKALTQRFSALACGITIVLLAVFGIKSSYDQTIHDLVEYDYLLRTANWDGIIAKAEKKSPNTPISVATLNLALAMKNQLDTRAFDFFQHGPDGLFPTFGMDGNTAMFLSELYYHLGMINTSQRYAFEAMEANSNYKKSARCIKRLATTNMLRGDYKVSEKYLKLLDKTSVYKNWADRTRQLMSDSSAIDRHPQYGEKRRLMIDDDFLFSETELDKIMGRLYTTHPENTVARQYLLMYPLLERNLDKFMQYMQAVESTAGTVYRPRLVQQGMIMAFVNAGKQVPDGLVDPVVAQQFAQFARTMTSSGKDSPAMDAYRGTLWYFLVKGQ